MTPTEARALADRLDRTLMRLMADPKRDGLAHTVAECQIVIRFLADQVEALQTDAERYRWLQSNVDGISWCVTHDGNTGSSDWLIGAELNAAIDRAREAT